MIHATPVTLSTSVLEWAMTVLIGSVLLLGSLAFAYAIANNDWRLVEQFRAGRADAGDETDE